MINHKPLWLVLEFTSSSLRICWKLWNKTGSTHCIKRCSWFPLRPFLFCISEYNSALLSEMDCYQGCSVSWVSDEVGMQEKAFNEICWRYCWCWLTPHFVLICATLKWVKLKETKYAHWYFAAQLLFLCTAQSCTAYSDKDKLQRVLLYKETCTATYCESLTINITDFNVFSYFRVLYSFPLASLWWQTRLPLLMQKIKVTKIWAIFNMSVCLHWRKIF